MRMLRVRSVAHFEGLKLNRWGIRELDPEDVSLFFIVALPRADTVAATG
jgi:hypothetical protein